MCYSGPMVHTIPSSLQALAPVINHYGYFAVFGLLFLEDFGVPVPGETMLIAASVFAGLGKLNIVVIVLVAIAAAFAGDNLGYVIGKYGGRRLLDRYGKYVLMTPEKIDKATGYFDRNGGRIVILARFVEGLRQLNGILAGASDMLWRTFAFFNLIGATLWVCTWAGVGYYGGDHIVTIEKYGSYLSVAAAVLIAGFFVVRHIVKKRRTDQKTAA